MEGRVVHSSGPDRLTFMFDTALEYWPHVVGIASLSLSLGVSAHIVLTKRDPRAAVGWVGIAWLVPLLGSVLYFVFGINRIQRRATALRRLLERFKAAGRTDVDATETSPRGLSDLRHLVRIVTEEPLLPGNRVSPLVGGADAYDAMLKAIDSAAATVTLTTYIFNDDDVGRLFVERLSAAVERGVAVRVLVDAVGARYSGSSIVSRLREYGVTCARFMPTKLPWRFRYLNLRTHRKIAVVDGRLGFTGGLNIREECSRTDDSRVEDLHFEIEGPVVAHLQHCFTEDWAFATGELLEGAAWFPDLESVGPVEARGVPDGPDEDIDKLHWTILGALAAARSPDTSCSACCGWRRP